MFDALIGCWWSVAIPPDPEGAEDFRVATLGIPTKTVAGWMGVCESQITRWRQTGNVPGGRVRLLPEDVRHKYRALQARREQVAVIDRDMVAGAVEAINAVLAAFGWRPAMVRASLGACESASSSGCGRKVSSAA